MSAEFERRGAGIPHPTPMKGFHDGRLHVGSQLVGYATVPPRLDACVAQQFNTAFPYKKMIATSHTGYAKLLRLAICRPITANA
jgi:hypothetical protein